MELIFDGIEHKGTNLVDLAGQRRPEPLVHRLPGQPPGFVEFMAALRCANASRELVRSRCRWSQIYSNDDGSDDDDHMEVGDVRTKSEPSEVEDEEEEELWEEEAIDSPRTDPSAMMADNSHREDYPMPPHSDK